MGIKITDMTTTTADGTEIIPTSKAAAPRSVTVESIKDYVVDAIEAITTGSAPSGSDSVFVMQGGVLKPIDIDLLMQYVVNAIWAETAETSLASGDKLPLYDVSEGAENTVTLSTLSTYLASAVSSTLLDVSTLADGSGAIATTDYMLVTQGTTPKRIQISDLSTLIYTSLATHVTGKSLLGDNGDNDDVLYVVRGSTPYKVKLSQLATFMGNSDTPINDATAIGEALEGTDTFLVDNGANGTERKSEISRLKTYMETAGTYKTLWVPAKVMTPSTTAGATATTKEFTTTNDMTHSVMTFAGLVADDNAEFDVVMPEGWDRSTIKAKLYWTNGDAAANVGEYVGFYLAGGARSNDDPLDATNGTEVLMADQLIADDDLHISAASADITIGGSPGLGDMIHFKLRRDWDYNGGGTAMDVDAYVLGVLIQYRENLEAAAW